MQIAIATIRDGADSAARAERRSCPPSRPPTISIGLPFCPLDGRTEFGRALGETR